MTASNGPAVAPRSIDRVRLVRCSMRCFVYGAIGLVPILGAGLAVQALRLRDRVELELNERRKAPPVLLYWLVGLVVLWAADAAFGGVGASAACVVLLALQSVHIARHMKPSADGARNPAHRQVVLGVIFAYAGLGLCWWLLGVLGRRVVEMSAVP